MVATPFHAYYAARKLASYVDDNSLLPAFASSTLLGRRKLPIPRWIGMN